MLNVECIQNDKDVSAEIQRADFEAWITPICERLLPPLPAALDAAGMTIKDIDCVELVGGSTRVPLVKETIAKFFGGSLDGGLFFFSKLKPFRQQAFIHAQFG